MPNEHTEDYQQSFVSATGRWYLAADRDWNRTGWSWPSCCSTKRDTYLVRESIGTGPLFYITINATQAPIQHLGSDYIMTWSICSLWSSSPSVNSRYQICDWTNIHWIPVKECDIWAEKCRFAIVIQWTLVQPQMWERKGTEGPTLHSLRTDHLTIPSVMTYLIGSNIVDLKCHPFSGNPVQWSGSGLEPDPEPNLDFGPASNTNCYKALIHASNWVTHCLELYHMVEILIFDCCVSWKWGIMNWIKKYEEAGLHMSKAGWSNYIK